VLVKVAREVTFELKHGIGGKIATHKVVIVAKEPQRGEKLQGGAPAGNPRAELPRVGVPERVAIRASFFPAYQPSRQVRSTQS
jgi:hypothetical protein